MIRVAKKGNSKKVPERRVEAALFSAGRPLSMGEMADLTGLALGPIRRAVKRLQRAYRSRETSIEVAKVGSRYTMQVKAEYADAAMKVAPGEIPRRLIKTLALVAYHQPIKQSELRSMIGDKVYDHVRELISMGLLYGKKHGQTKILITSKSFPEYFGIGTTNRDKIRKWIAEKVGLKAPEKTLSIHEFEDVEKNLEAEAVAASEEDAGEEE